MARSFSVLAQRQLWRDLLLCVGPKNRRGLLLLIGMMLLMAALEAVSAALFVPFTALLSGSAQVKDYRALTWAIDRFALTTPYAGLLLSCAALTLAFVLKNLYGAWYVYYRAAFVRRCHARFACELLGIYLRQDYTYHVKHNSSELLRNINQDVNNIFANVLTSALLILIEALIALTLLAMMLSVMPPLGLVAMGVFVTACVAFFRASQRRVVWLGEQQRHHSGLMLKWMMQALGGIKETKIMGKEPYFLDAFDHHITAFSAYNARYTLLRETPRFFIETSGVAVMMTITLILALDSAQSVQILPSLSLFAVAAFRMLPSASRITQALSSLRFFAPSLTQVCQDVRDGAPTLDAGAEAAPSSPALTMRHALELSDVTFTYPEAARPVLQGLSLTLRVGASIALVGASGAGKTTVVDVMLGLLTPQQGRVLVDGQPITAQLTQWQRQIGYISQPIYLLDDTIRRNVAFGERDEQIDDARVWDALRQAQLFEAIEALPQGLDAVVGEGGMMLSGGQRQRIGIARVLYRDPQILIFDEATSALDTVTEHEITRAIEQLHGQKTIVLIAHRLSTIRACDMIYLLEAGRVRDAGTFEELVARDPQFKTMVELNALGA